MYRADAEISEDCRNELPVPMAAGQSGDAPCGMIAPGLRPEGRGQRQPFMPDGHDDRAAGKERAQVRLAFKLPSCAADRQVEIETREPGRAATGDRADGGHGRHGRAVARREGRHNVLLIFAG